MTLFLRNNVTALASFYAFKQEACFLAAADLTQARSVKVKKTLDSFQAALSHGHRPKIEDWLHGVEESQRTSQLRQLLSIELSWRAESGVYPEPNEYKQRFPDAAPEIDRVFAELPQTPTSDEASADLNTALEPTLIPGWRVWDQVSEDAREFGAYELLEEVARGGMGVVFKARHTKLNRIVALKMILSGEFADAKDIRRFRIEAEAAANLNHPGIVPIFDVGQHAGRHYFSMAFVEGPSLEAYVKKGPLSPYEAAEITLAISSAVAHAHEHGVIHRDLKPANILLDAAGEPKVTDFGLARNIEDVIKMTQTGSIMGSPSYMAPEQADGRTHEVGVSSDVYSIGATLFCLLSGKPPFHGKSIAETLRCVIHELPPKLQSAGRNIPRDLATICECCLEKRPSDRYQTAEALAEDLHRFLNHFPVQARRATPSQHCWRWCQRNRAVATLMCTIATLVCCSMLFLLRYNRQQIASAEQQMMEAGIRLDKTVDDVEMLYSKGDTFFSENADLAESERLELEQSLEDFEHAVERYEDLVKNDAADSARLHGAAVAQFQVGQANQYLGNLELAEGAYRSAIQRFAVLSENFPGELRHRFRGAVTWDHLGEVLRMHDETTEAEKAYQKALQLLSELTNEPQNIAFHEQELSRIHNNYGIFLLDTCRQRDAQKHFRAADSILSSLVEQEANNEDFMMDYARTLLNLGLLNESSTPTEANAQYQRADAVFTRLTESQPEVPRYRFLLAVCEMNRGFVLGSALQRPVEAKKLLTAAEKRFRELPPSRLYRLRHADCLNNLGVLSGISSDMIQAKNWLEKAHAVATSLVSDYPDTPEHHSQLGKILGGLAAAANGSGNSESAAELANEAIDHQTQAWQKNSCKYWRLLVGHHLFAGQLLLSRSPLTDADRQETISQVRRAVNIAQREQRDTAANSPFEGLLNEPFSLLWSQKEFLSCLQQLQEMTLLKLPPDRVPFVIAVESKN